MSILIGHYLFYLGTFDREFYWLYETCLSNSWPLIGRKSAHVHHDVFNTVTLIGPLVVCQGQKRTNNIWPLKTCGHGGSESLPYTEGRPALVMKHASPLQISLFRISQCSAEKVTRGGVL